MSNKEALDRIVKDLNEYIRLLELAKNESEKVRKASMNHRLNRGRMTTPQIVAYRQAVMKLITAYDAMSEIIGMFNDDLSEIVPDSK